MDSGGESAQHTVIHLYDKLCGVNLNTHATCYHVLTTPVVTRLSRITVLW